MSDAEYLVWSEGCTLDETLDEIKKRIGELWIKLREQERARA